MATKRQPAPEPPAELIDQLKAGQVVPFIGAGFSRTAQSKGAPGGLPTYTELLLRLLEAAKLASYDDEVIRNYLRRTDAEDPDHNDTAAGLLRKAMKNVPFYMTLRDILEPIDRSFEGSLAHRFLGLLGFRRIVTTNYDRLLERFAVPGHEVITPKDQQAFRLFMNDTRRQFILKLHGDITRPDTIPWGRAELLRFYGYDSYGTPVPGEDTSGLRDFLKELFERNSVLFLGTSLSSTEGYAQFLIDLVSAWGGGLPCRHFVLVPFDESLKALRDDLGRRMNLQYIYYYPDAQHTQVWEFISFLKAGRPKSSPQPGQPWEQWYHQRERPDYLQAQLDRELTATSVRYLTPRLTNAIASAEFLATDCCEELEGRYDPEVIERTLSVMKSRAANIEKRLREEGLEVRILFLESELRASLDPAAASGDKLARAVARYRRLLELIESTDLEVRVIPGLSSEELKGNEASFALIFNRVDGQAAADVTIAYSSQANNDFPEIHMVLINTQEIWRHTFTFERLWAAARNEEATRRLIVELVTEAAQEDSRALL